MRAAADKLVRRGQRIDKAGADGLQVECRALVGDAELLLHEASGARENVVGRGRGDDDQVDVLAVDTGRLDRPFGRLDGQVARRDIGLGPVTRRDAAARDDPLVASLDALLGKLSRQVGVRDAPRRQICLLYTSPSPRDQRGSRMPSSA